MTAELIATLTEIRDSLGSEDQACFLASGAGDSELLRLEAALDGAIADVRRMDALDQVRTIDGNSDHGYFFEDADFDAWSVGGDGETFRQVVDDYAAKVEVKINKGER